MCILCYTSVMKSVHTHILLSDPVNEVEELDYQPGSAKHLAMVGNDKEESLNLAGQVSPVFLTWDTLPS